MISSTEKIKKYLLKEANIQSIRAILQAQARAKVDRGEHSGKPYGFLHHKINVDILENEYASGGPSFRGGINVPIAKIELKNIEDIPLKNSDETKKNYSLMCLFKWDWNYDALSIPNRIVSVDDGEYTYRKWLLNAIYFLYTSKSKQSRTSSDPFSSDFMSKYNITKRSKNYETTIGFPSYEILAKKIYDENLKYREEGREKQFREHFHRNLMKTDVSLHCQCNSFRFYYAYTANQKKSAIPGVEENRPAPKNNPKNFGIGCKHIHSILFGQISFSDVVKKFIANTVLIKDGNLVIKSNEFQGSDEIVAFKRASKKGKTPKQDTKDLATPSDKKPKDKAKEPEKKSIEPVKPEEPTQQADDDYDLYSMNDDLGDDEVIKSKEPIQQTNDDDDYDLYSMNDDLDDDEIVKSKEPVTQANDDDDFDLYSMNDDLGDDLELPETYVTDIKSFNKRINDLDAEQVVVSDLTLDDFPKDEDK